MYVIQLGPYPPPYGGVQANLVSIRERLRRTGIDSCVVNLTRHRQPEANGVFFPETALQTAVLLVRQQCRILHLHIGGGVPIRVAALALFCTLIPGRRTVLTFHSGGYPASPQGKAARRFSFRGLAFRRFDRVIVVNDQLRDVFLRYGVPLDRIRLIAPHAIDVNEMASQLPPRLAAFAAVHRPLLLSVGLLEPEYDIPSQLALLGRLRERQMGAGLVIIGSGSLEPSLREHIASLSYRDHVLLTGDMPHADALRAIREADVLLRTTRYDGDAVSVREALCLGTPVVATDNGMRPHGVTLVSVEDFDRFDAAVERVLADPAKRHMREGLTGEENLTAVLALYRELAQPE
ncbi:MAG: hypothetical protein MNPFHGCM_02062 [Gemmatimonadaceae bacterium]|nr:hypothetical protein [Gemmatimonadaceae bacterium]